MNGMAMLFYKQSRYHPAPINHFDRTFYENRHLLIKIIITGDASVDLSFVYCDLHLEQKLQCLESNLDMKKAGKKPYQFRNCEKNNSKPIKMCCCFD